MTLFVVFMFGGISGFLGCFALLFSFWRRMRRPSIPVTPRAVPVDPREAQLADLEKADAVFACVVGGARYGTKPFVEGRQ